MPSPGLSSPSVFLSGLAAVVVLAFADGGYFRETWAWTTVAFSCLACLALLLRERIDVGRLDVATVGVLAALVAWVALSAGHSVVPDDSLAEAERGLVYVAAVLAFVLLVASEQVHALLAGVATGVTLVAAYALATRVFAGRPIESDPVQGTLLFEPLGYANALAILTGMGALVALGLAIHGRTRRSRAVWAAAPIVLLSTLALTESRATWLALVVGLGVSALFEAHRRKATAVVLVLAAPAALAVWLTWRSTELTDVAATAQETTDAGRRLALALGGLVVVSALAGVGSAGIEARLERFRVPWSVWGALLGLLASLLTVAALWSDLSLGPRTAYWRVAWEQWQDNAWLGSGAGTFSEYWRREQVPQDVLDAHSLYVETLAELGPVGVGLLLCALAVPVVAAVSARAKPLVGTAAGAYAAYLVHAGLDWDWEMPAVTVTGLLCGVALLASARPGRHQIELGRSGRLTAAVCAVAVAGLAVVIHTATR